MPSGELSGVVPDRQGRRGFGDTAKMARVILVTGGSRSGKSRQAQRIAEEEGNRKVFVATCPRVDAEMTARIRRHQEERAGKGWETVEEGVDLAGVLARTAGEVVLVDCLTLWINNLLFTGDRAEDLVDEDWVAARCGELLDICRGRQGTVIFVTNEVGLGIVPENPLARRFRDLVGRCNQVMAHRADRVLFMVSGLPLILK